MITSQAADYANVLFSMGLQEESIQKSKQILSENPELIAALDNPIIKKKEKEAIIDDVFENGFRSFLKVVCDHRRMGSDSSVPIERPRHRFDLCSCLDLRSSMQSAVVHSC